MNNNIQYKSVDVLQFDPQNPRLPSTVNGHDEQAVLEWMLRDATIIELMLSIGEKGYFPGEPLLVVPDPHNPYYYLVVEGNRRLAAVKLLFQPQLAPIRSKAVEQASVEAKQKPQELPTLIFEKREEILDYLGYRHITGIKPWGALAKAKYLKQLLDALGEGNPKEQYQILAKTIGSRSSYVARILAGFAVYEKIVEADFFDIKNLNEESIDFSVLTTALNYQNIYKFIGMENSQDRALNEFNKKNLGELISWIFEKNSEGRTRLGESRNLGDLNSVIGNEKALESFRNSIPLSDAVLYTEVPTKIFRIAMNESKSKLELARDNIHRVDDLSSTDADLLLDIQKLARNLRTLVDDKLMEVG